MRIRRFIWLLIIPSFGACLEVRESGMISGAFWWRLVVTILLVIAAGLFAGLTLGLLSLDIVKLEILKNSGTAKERKYATVILPLRKRGHLLLVTLLIANAAATETLPLFLNSLVTAEWQAILLSTVLVLVFGEILPQALCARYGLMIGAKLVWLVQFMIIIEFIVAWPISKFLDWILGRSKGTVYGKAELRELVHVHEQYPESHLTHEEGTILKAVLDFKEKTVLTALTPLKDVFMLNVDTILTMDILKLISERGHSRIPIYEEPYHIMGVILVKTLLLVDPKAQIRLRDINHTHLIKVHSSHSLFDMLDYFQEGKCHMALVENEASQPIGIITLEDVIEELIGEEIIDETDVYIDVAKKIRVARVLQQLESKKEATEIKIGITSSL
jgi:metal transporter CNNM